VRLVRDMDELLAECDAVLLCSLDGRPHLGQFESCAMGKPVFVDKPVAASLKDAAALYRVAEETRTPVFSASALRFAPEVIEVALAEVGRVAGAMAHGPCPLEPHHPDLFFYGMHAAEALFRVMGPGCQQVSRITTVRASVVTGIWSDESGGTLFALHHWPAPYRVIKMGDRSVATREVSPGYPPLLREIVRFCRTGIPPVSKAQTLELYAFMEAADESKRRGGVAVALQEIFEKTRL
jgi:predicted dehydrogenase